jgi:hypothetical protein
MEAKKRRIKKITVESVPKRAEVAWFRLDVQRQTEKPKPQD